MSITKYEDKDPPAHPFLKVSKYPASHMTRFHPQDSLTKTFSKGILVSSVFPHHFRAAVIGHMLFCLALYQNRSKAILCPKQLMEKVARDTHS